MCQLGNFKGLYLNGFSIGNVWETCNPHSFQALAPAEALLVSSFSAFDGLHNDIKMLAVDIEPKVGSINVIVIESKVT